MLDGRVIVIIGDPVGLADHLRALGATVYASFDLADAASASIDVVVHAPAVLPEAQSIADTSDDDWDARGEAQLRAGLHSCQAGFAHLRGRGGGIILVTPTAGLVGEAGFVPIATASAGLRALAKAAARQWGEHGVTVNCVAPSLALLGAQVPTPVNPPALGREATVEDLARAIALLASDAAGSITGVTIPVDGGVVMLP